MTKGNTPKRPHDVAIFKGHRPWPKLVAFAWRFKTESEARKLTVRLGEILEELHEMGLTTERLFAVVGPTPDIEVKVTQGEKEEGNKTT